MEHTERPRAMRSRDDYIINFVAYFLCSLVLIATLYPLIYVVSASFSEPSEVINGNIWLLPKNVTLDGYEMILDYDPIWIGYRNTIFYTVFGTAFNLLLTLPCAYSLSRRDFRGRKGIMLLFTFTMFFSGGMIPTYLAMKSFGLLNSPFAVIFPGAVNVTNLIIPYLFCHQHSLGIAGGRDHRRLFQYRPVFEDRAAPVDAHCGGDRPVLSGRPLERLL